MFPFKTSKSSSIAINSELVSQVHYQDPRKLFQSTLACCCTSAAVTKKNTLLGTPDTFLQRPCSNINVISLELQTVFSFSIFSVCKVSGRIWKRKTRQQSLHRQTLEEGWAQAWGYNGVWLPSSGTASCRS